MGQIILTRIDNRLVHGQVGILWTSSIGANIIVVVDDEVANNEMQQQIMGITAKSSNVDIRFFTVDKTIEVIHKASEKQKIFLVCRTPQVVLKLIEGGVDIREVNVGNMHMSEGKIQWTKRVFVDSNDTSALYKIKELIGNIYIQDTPGDSKSDLK